MTRLRFIAPRTTDTCIQLEFFDGIQQCHCLQHIPAGILSCFFFNPSLVN